MGLAMVEMVIVVEDEFGIPIPDRDMALIPTPRALVDYLVGKLAPASPEVEEHSSRRAFAALRQAVLDAAGPQREELVPSTTWDSVLPRSHVLAEKLWADIERRVGVPLPRVHGAQATLGQTAIHLSEHGTPGPDVVARLRGRDEIRTTVHRLIREQLEVRDFTDDTPFAEMGLG